MPIVFVGHGSPMNAIEDNVYGKSFENLATLLPRPQAILAISAHWFVEGTWVTGQTQPPTVHDFSGFPKELFEIQYPAPGHVELAQRVAHLLKPVHVALDDSWGFDHGTWSVLSRTFPEADIPVIQLSLDARLPMEKHVDLGKRLAPLRSEGVLIFATGNITHNLRDAFTRLQRGMSDTPRWAASFDEEVKHLLLEKKVDALHRLWPTSETARLAHPSPDHWIPLLYAAGAAWETDVVEFPMEGFDAGSLSMRSVLWRAR